MLMKGRECVIVNRPAQATHGAWETHRHDGYLTKPFDIRRFLEVVDGARQRTQSPAVAAVSRVLNARVIASLHRLESNPSIGREEIADLVREFLSDASQRLCSLHDAVAAGDTGRVVREAHAMAGGSAGLGAAQLADLCKAIESAGKHDDAAGARLLAVELDRALGDARAALLEEFGLASQDDGGD